MTRLEYSIQILHTPTMCAGLENLTLTWPVRGPSIHPPCSSPLRCVNMQFLVRTKYTPYHSTAYALRHIIHPVYPVPIPTAPTLRKMGFQNASSSDRELRRGEARCGERREARCTGTCVVLAATGSELSCSGSFLEGQSTGARGYFTLGWTMVPDSRYCTEDSVGRLLGLIRISGVSLSLLTSTLYSNHGTVTVLTANRLTASDTHKK